MEKEDMILSTLRQRYQDREWFGDVGYDKFGRPVLYVKHECHETIWDIPDKWEGKQLLVHFHGSLTARADGFYAKSETKSILPTHTFDVAAFKASVAEAHTKGFDTGFVGAMEEEDRERIFADLEKKRAEEEEKQLELSVHALTDELDKLERLCGSNILQDIFYEVHDKTNAVTNLSAKFPEVRTRVQKLYDKFGFDIIYEELDG